MLQITLERKKRKLTQKQMAEQIGISDRAYRRLECGISLPSYEVLKKIEDILGLKSPHRRLFAEYHDFGNAKKIKKTSESERLQTGRSS